MRRFRISLWVPISAYAVVVAVFIAGLSVFWMLAQFAHPVADDFSYANLYRSSGYWEAIRGEYLGWKGRYFALLFTAWFHQNFDIISVYTGFILATQAALFGSIVFYIHALRLQPASTLRVLVSGVFFYGLYLFSMPGTASGIYWLDVVFQYQFGNITMLATLATVFLWLAKPLGKSPWPYAVAASFFASASIGSAEMTIPAVNAIVWLPAFFIFLRRDRPVAPWVLTGLIVVISTWVATTAPGNAVRYELVHGSDSLARALSHGIFYTFSAVSGWVANPLLLAISVLFLLTIRPSKISRVGWVPDRWKALAIWACTLILVFINIFASWWVAFTNPPTRAENVNYFIFLVGWFLGLHALTFAVQRRFLVFPSLVIGGSGYRLIVAAAVIGVGWAAFSQPNLARAVTDLTQRAYAYDQTMQKRYQRVRQARRNGDRSVVVPAVRFYPSTVVFDDIRSDPKDWQNIVFARYFGLNEVRTARSGPVQE